MAWGLEMPRASCSRGPAHSLGLRTEVLLPCLQGSPGQQGASTWGNPAWLTELQMTGQLT